MEGKGITELRGAGTATGEGLRFNCQLEESSISFCDLEEPKLKQGGQAGQAFSQAHRETPDGRSACPGLASCQFAPSTHFPSGCGRKFTTSQ